MPATKIGRPSSGHRRLVDELLERWETKWSSRVRLGFPERSTIGRLIDEGPGAHSGGTAATAPLDPAVERFDRVILVLPTRPHRELIRLWTLPRASARNVTACASAMKLDVRSFHELKSFIWDEIAYYMRWTD